MTDEEAEAVTNLGARLSAAQEVIAEQLEIRNRLEGHLNQALADCTALQEANTEAAAREERLREAIKRGNGAYQVSLADQAKARRDAKHLVGTIETLLRKHEAYHNSIEHAAARQLLREIRGEA